jgi:hypothetical protein
VCCLACVARVNFSKLSSDPADPPRPHLPNSVESNMTYAAQQLDKFETQDASEDA